MPVNIYTLLETQAIEMLLDGGGESFKILQQQFANSKAKSREFTEVGFYTNLEIDKNIGLIDCRHQIIIRDIIGYATEARDGIDFLLWINNGRLDFLECVSYGVTWPKDNDIGSFELSYTSDNKGRNIEDFIVN